MKQLVITPWCVMGVWYFALLDLNTWDFAHRLDGKVRTFGTRSGARGVRSRLVNGGEY